MTAAPKNPYEFHAFDAQRLASTKKHWRAALKKVKADVVESEFERILGWVEEHVDYSAKCEQFAYGVFEHGKDHAIAVCEVLYSKVGPRWLKMFNVHLEPGLDVRFADGEMADMTTIALIYTAAVIGTVRLTGLAHPTSVAKLYGRSGTLLQFLKGVAASFSGDKAIDGVTVTMEGRWLVFKTAKTSTKQGTK